MNRNMNWAIFNLKYENREQWAFEQMSYLLFCAEMNCRIGLFRYKNQTGIETDPIEKDGIYYGFQAKYYSSSISKNDIIDSIKKAKDKNSQLNTIYLYLNQELSESSKTDSKKPQYQIDIENSALNIGINIEWRVPSNFEIQLAFPENKYINDIFFNLDGSENNLIDDIYKHNANILQAIQTKILFHDKEIKINRTEYIQQIKQSLENVQNIIISGEGGCGKTAIFKDFYNQHFHEVPICIYKATELNVNHINDIFRFDYNFTFNQFLEVYQSELKKIFVIDSAEKLAELTNNDILLNLIQTLKDNNWIIIFTTRYSYLNDLSFHIKENYHLPCKIIDIPIINSEELNRLSAEYNFTLPDNYKFLERLRNLFYLNEYIQFYSTIDKSGNLRSFIDLLWKKRIQNNSNQKDNLHLERENCLISIVKERCKTGLFYINAEKLSQSALFQLKQDEILGYDEVHNGYFITHDIFEEWALDKIISRNYANHTDTMQFFEELGSSLSIKRAFRLWLSEQLYNDINEIEAFIQDTFTNTNISQFWKDELLVSVLLSNYSEIFFEKFDKEIKLNDFEILKRIMFLLGIACKEEDTHLSKLLGIDSINYIFTKPRGKGWDETIKYIYSNRENVLPILKIFIPLLRDWNDNNKRGNTTRYSALTALYFYEHFENQDSYYGKEKKQLVPIILNGALEIKEELKVILDKVILNRWIYHPHSYYDLCHAILTSNKDLAILFTLPEEVLKLADLFWFESDDEENTFRYSGFDIEKYYSIRNGCHHDYFPASALQTPIYWLLESATSKTINFILEFTNKTIEKYANSEVNDPVKVIDIIIDEKTTVTQYINETIWCMYRGSGGIAKPHLLESIHMALEKFLLRLSKDEGVNTVESYLIYLLKNSSSASITAIVTSVILAYPEKFFNVATVLFKTLELFYIDNLRQQQESQAKRLYSIGSGMDSRRDVFANERLKTCEEKHRSLSIEDLFRNYQFFGVTGFTEEQNTELLKKIYDIIDSHKENILETQDDDKKSLEILIARIDRRVMHPTVKKMDDLNYIIEFNPELSSDLQEHSKQATTQFEEAIKYTSLRLWADFISEKRHQKSDQDINQKQKQYNDNPLLALEETKQLVDELNAGRRTMGIFDYSIPAFVCSKLIIEYRDKLTKEDKAFCKNIIFLYVSRLFSDEYDYQISDGVEAVIHAIPFLIYEYPEEIESFILALILCLFDKTSIGNYKRICDYVIDSIYESKIWELDPISAQSVLLGFIKLKPIYNKIYDEKRKVQGFWNKTPKSNLLQEFEETIKDFSFINISFDIREIELLDILDLEIVYQLIPYNTKDSIHLKIYEKTLPNIVPQLLIDRRNYKEEFGDASNIYLIRLYIFRRFAHFILERESNEIDIYLQPLINSFSATEEVALFLDEIVNAEDHNCKYDQFWYIWNKFYPRFIEISNGPNRFHLDNVTISYLLAWRWWRDGVEEWHSLKKENLLFYTNLAKDLGHNPTILFSISRVLNTIGSRFTQEGIDWIYTIIINNNSLELKKFESNTLYYIEKFMRRFVFMNKEQIKKTIRLKNKVVPILDFIIERGSIHGYLLRDSIL